MYSVLIRAVLSSSPDCGLLFESLSWPSDAWPGTERVEALTAFIEGLAAFMADADGTRLSAANRASIKDKADSVIWTQCLPLLSRVPLEAGDAAAVCRLVGVCVPLCDAAVPGRLAASVLPSLRLSDEELRAPGRLPVEVAAEVMAVLIPSLSDDEQLTLATLTSSVSCIRTLPGPLVSKVPVRMLMALLSCCSGARLGSILALLLDDLCGWHAADHAPAVTERALLCLTALSDHLLAPRGASCDPRLSLRFWRIVQDGLTHSDGVSRKRALYLLKKCVSLSEDEGGECPPAPSLEEEILFRWTPDRSKLLREFWEDYVLVMETLEENQVHVVRPVLNRIDTLIQTMVNNSQAPARGLLHPSWLLCVYQRIFHSENKSLMREGVCHLLELQVLQQPDFALAFSQFIVGPFMAVLSEASLFHRSLKQRLGECPELGVKLQVFVVNFFRSLPSDHRGHILLQMIQQLYLKHWCAVPLLFLARALSNLPSGPLLGVEGLGALREVLRSTMITHQVVLRGAAQCFLLSSALCLTEVSSVSLDDVFSFLMDFRVDESLCRGTRIWNRVCAWLLDNESRFKPKITAATATEKETVRSYVQNEICAYLRVPASTGQTERLPDSREADKLARAVLLCVDMEKNQPEREMGDTLEDLLAPLLDTLNRVGPSIYLPVRKSDKSLQLVLALLQLGRTPSCQSAAEKQVDNVMMALEKLMFKVADSVQEFILRWLSEGQQELFDVERAELYLCVLRQLVVMCSPAIQRHNETRQTYLPKVVKKSLKVLREPNQQIHSVANQVTRAVAMASLAMVCGLVEQEVIDMRSETFCVLKSLNDYFYSLTSPSSVSASSFTNFNKRLQRPQTGGGSIDGVQGPWLQDWGRIAASFLRDQWICLSFLIKAVGIPRSVENSRASETLKAALSCGVEALALLPSDLVVPVLSFMETVLPQLLPHEETLCVEVVTLSWELVQGLSTNAHDFWLALKAFVSVAFHQKLLELTELEAPTLVATLRQIASELMALSQSKSGVFGVLLQHCCQTWLPTADAFTSVFNHLDILTEACVYGPVFRRDQRLIQDVQTYVEQLGEECSTNVAATSGSRDDQFPRRCALAFLSRLDSSNLQHQRLMEELVVDLLKKDNNISKSKVRYYSNSLQHRIKNRVWQTLLLLMPKLREEFVTSVVSRVFEAGFCANQASVKYLIEWLIVLILVYYPQHIDHFWSCFSRDHDKTKTSSCTFLSVLVHFSVILPNLKDEGVHLGKALDVILQWCFNHNFSVRLYALLALKRVWRLAEDGADDLGGLSTVIKACLHQAEAMQSTGNANKNWMRIQEHFFFGAFHPIRDYSVETLFYTLPSLSELADDEWIPPWKFEKLSNFSETPSFPLRNPVADLSQLQPGDWIQQDQDEQNKVDRWAEVQKKISPWRLGIQEQELELQLVPQQRAARLGKLHSALLVVASLIDKPTNLGGLCRTCEIFGASALVLESLRHVSDKQFQSLSVSSELWLPLIEVKPAELTDFLQVKRSEGYCVVGVEQTANSRSLQDYRFPEKTLLLLGNEREGIPANLLQMLDVCVEIPQRGIIRSLNVHVSAALLIWEYTRQHLRCGSTGVPARCALGGAGRVQLLLEVLMVLMCLGAVTGNILVIVIVAATKTFHCVTSVLIMNLAVSDLLVGVGVMPFVARSVMNHGWVDLTKLCLYVGYTSCVYCTASVLTLAAIALDRYHSIMDCLRYSSRCTVRRTCAVVLWIWLQALATSCPPLLGWSSVSYMDPMYICAVNWARSPSYTAFMATLSYLIPAVVILFCYVNIVKVARGHARRIHTLEDSVQRSSNPTGGFDSSHQRCVSLHGPSKLIYHVSGQFVSEVGSALPHSEAEQNSPRSRGLFSFLAQSTSQPAPLQSSQQQQQQQQQQQHGVRRLFLVISAFFLCWTPYIGVVLIQATETAISGHASLVPPSAVTFSYWLLLLNSDINPLLYALLSKRFQGALLGLRHKIRARLGSVVGFVRSDGEDRRSRNSCSLTTAHPRPPSTAEISTGADVGYSSSIFTVSTEFQHNSEEHLFHRENASPSCSVFQGAACDTGLDFLRVPSGPPEGKRLPFSALTKERQATFFYGQITVRVEHDVC
ncbi:probable methyltransferase TARBP1 [Brachionichthys hirsutus]|uniref:probable methyltransferase TARBP1 n=1 Tax=Brachionichthys hirsutus TaxID=412623 RepID=UPI003604DCB0